MTRSLNCFSSLSVFHSFFAFLASIFFFLLRAFSRLHFGGKCFWESFQGLKIRYVGRLWNKIFMGIFGLKVHVFFPFFSGLRDQCSVLWS